MNIADTSVRSVVVDAIDERFGFVRVEPHVVEDQAWVDVVLEAGAGVTDRAVTESAQSRHVGELRELGERVADQLLGSRLLVGGDAVDTREIDRSVRVPRARPRRRCCLRRGGRVVGVAIGRVAVTIGRGRVGVAVGRLRVAVGRRCVGVAVGRRRIRCVAVAVVGRLDGARRVPVIRSARVVAVLVRGGVDDGGDHERRGDGRHGGDRKSARWP